MQISEAVVARATFRVEASRRKIVKTISQQRRRARAQTKALSLALIISYYVHILLSASARCMHFTPDHHERLPRSLRDGDDLSGFIQKKQQIENQEGSLTPNLKVRKKTARRETGPQI